MTRDWIITVLRGLPVWCWPVFLWDVMRVRAWWQALPIRADALMTLGVTGHGRIVVTGVYEGDVPAAEESWMAYAPREPWRRLATDNAAGVPDPSDKPVVWSFLVIPSDGFLRPLSAGPDFLDSG